MKRALIVGLVLIGILFFIQTNKKESPSHPSPKDQTVTITGNLKRTFLIHFPPLYSQNSHLPAVIVLHGGVSNSKEAQKLYGWDKTADTNNFVTVYPQATGDEFLGKLLGIWNAEKCCAPATTKQINDVGFLDGVIEKLKKDFRIDPNRIYVTGISNGSMMTFRAACELSDKIAAVGGVSGQGLHETCNTTRPVPVIYFHGTNDKCAQYYGGFSEGCYNIYFKELLGVDWHADSWTFDSAPEYVNKWKKINNTAGTDQTIFSNNSTTCVSSGFNTNREVAFCSINGGGHTWPGQTSYGDNCKDGMDSHGCKVAQSVMGPLNTETNANDILWEFFKRHSLHE